MQRSSNLSTKNNTVLFRSWQNPNTLPLVFSLTAGGEIVCHDPNDNTTPDRIYDPDILFVNCVMLCEQIKQQAVDTDKSMATFSDSHTSDLIELMDKILKPALHMKREAEKLLAPKTDWLSSLT